MTIAQDLIISGRVDIDAGEAICAQYVDGLLLLPGGEAGPAGALSEQRGERVGGLPSQLCSKLYLEQKHRCSRLIRSDNDLVLLC